MSDSGPLSRLGNTLAGLVLGEVVGIVAEELTNRIRLHRPELGAPSSGPGSGKMESLADLSLDALCNTVFLMMGITMVESAMPGITNQLPAMIMFIMGISVQTTLPTTVQKLTKKLLSTPDSVTVPNTSN
jgi:hypothetical protein